MLRIRRMQPNSFALLVNERAADIVEVLNDQSHEVAASVLLGLPRELAVEVLDQSGLDSAAEILTIMPRGAPADLLNGISADRLADICRQLDEPHGPELLVRLDPDTRGVIQRLLAYRSTPLAPS